MRRNLIAGLTFVITTQLALAAQAGWLEDLFTIKVRTERRSVPQRQSAANRNQAARRNAQAGNRQAGNGRIRRAAQGTQAPAPPAIGIHRNGVRTHSPGAVPSQPAPPAVGVGRGGRRVTSPQAAARQPAPPAIGVHGAVRENGPPVVRRHQPAPPAVAAGIPTPPHYHVPTPPHYHVPTPPHYHTGHSAGAFDWLGYFGGCGWSANACEPLPFDCQFPIVETESGMRIDQLGMYAVIPGGELEIVGSHFGAAQGSKIVALSKDGLVGAEVMSWSDQSIRIRIPEGIPYGKYKVLIYYDDSLSTSSNSKSVLVVGGL